VDLAGDAFLGFVLGDIEIILALEADPEFRGSTNIPGKAEGQFCGDTSPPTDKRIHGGRGHQMSQRFSDLIAHPGCRSTSYEG
jgi:hypothetical protein